MSSKDIQFEDTSFFNDIFMDDVEIEQFQVIPQHLLTFSDSEISNDLNIYYSKLLNDISKVENHIQKIFDLRNSYSTFDFEQKVSGSKDFLNTPIPSLLFRNVNDNHEICIDNQFILPIVSDQQKIYTDSFELSSNEFPGDNNAELSKMSSWDKDSQYINYKNAIFNDTVISTPYRPSNTPIGLFTTLACNDHTDVLRTSSSSTSDNLQFRALQPSVYVPLYKYSMGSKKTPVASYHSEIVPHEKFDLLGLNLFPLLDNNSNNYFFKDTTLLKKQPTNSMSFQYPPISNNELSYFYFSPEDGSVSFLNADNNSFLNVTTLEETNKNIVNSKTPKLFLYPYESKSLERNKFISFQQSQEDVIRSFPSIRGILENSSLDKTPANYSSFFSHLKPFMYRDIDINSFPVFQFYLHAHIAHDLRKVVESNKQHAEIISKFKNILKDYEIPSDSIFKYSAKVINDYAKNVDMITSSKFYGPTAFEHSAFSPEMYTIFTSLVAHRQMYLKDIFYLSAIRPFLMKEMTEQIQKKYSGSDLEKKLDEIKELIQQLSDNLESKNSSKLPNVLSYDAKNSDNISLAGLQPTLHDPIKYNFHLSRRLAEHSLKTYSLLYDFSTNSKNKINQANAEFFNMNTLRDINLEFNVPIRSKLNLIIPTSLDSLRQMLLENNIDTSFLDRNFNISDDHSLEYLLSCEREHLYDDKVYLIDPSTKDIVACPHRIPLLQNNFDELDTYKVETNNGFMCRNCGDTIDTMSFDYFEGYLGDDGESVTARASVLNMGGIEVAGTDVQEETILANIAKTITYEPDKLFFDEFTIKVGSYLAHLLSVIDVKIPIQDYTTLTQTVSDKLQANPAVTSLDTFKSIFLKSKQIQALIAAKKEINSTVIISAFNKNLNKEIFENIASALLFFLVSRHISFAKSYPSIKFTSFDFLIREAGKDNTPGVVYLSSIMNTISSPTNPAVPMIQPAGETLQDKINRTVKNMNNLIDNVYKNTFTEIIKQMETEFNYPDMYQFIDYSSLKDPEAMKDKSSMAHLDYLSKQLSKELIHLEDTPIPIGRNYSYLSDTNKQVLDKIRKVQKEIRTTIKRSYLPFVGRLPKVVIPTVQNVDLPMSTEKSVSNLLLSELNNDTIKMIQLYGLQLPENLMKPESLYYIKYLFQFQDDGSVRAFDNQGIDILTNLSAKVLLENILSLKPAQLADKANTIIDIRCKNIAVSDNTPSQLPLLENISTKPSILLDNLLKNIAKSLGKTDAFIKQYRDKLSFLYNYDLFKTDEILEFSSFLKVFLLQVLKTSISMMKYKPNLHQRTLKLQYVIEEKYRDSYTFLQSFLDDDQQRLILSNLTVKYSYDDIQTIYPVLSKWDANKKLMIIDDNHSPMSVVTLLATKLIQTLTQFIPEPDIIPLNSNETNIISNFILAIFDELIRQYKVFIMNKSDIDKIRGDLLRVNYEETTKLREKTLEISGFRELEKQIRFIRDLNNDAMLEFVNDDDMSQDVEQYEKMMKKRNAKSSQSDTYNLDGQDGDYGKYHNNQVYGELEPVNNDFIAEIL
jgi:hypothetical protein